MDVTNGNVNGESVLSGDLETVASPANREQIYTKEYSNLRKIQKPKKLKKKWKR